MHRNVYKWFAVILLSFLLFSCGDTASIRSGNWKINYDPESKGVHIEKEGKRIYENVYASYKLSGKLITTRDYTNKEVERETVEDLFGKGSVLRLTFKGAGLPTLIQSFYVYPGKDYILTDFTLEDQMEISSNYMAPVTIDRMSPVLEKGDNRALFIPFDNDKWIRYQSHPLTFDKLTSYEATAIFNNQTRKGLVIGSVEHDSWKTAIDIGKSDHSNPATLVCYGGAADTLTRDVKPHGALKGTRIKSPKILLGYFDDWRIGLETYAKANATIAPPKTWEKGIPFGWNSWGVLQFNLTYGKALEVSDFFKNKLQNNHFADSDNTVMIGLDSGWNRFTEEELKSFVDHCKANGQKAGIYWTPFTDWGKNPERVISDAPDYQFKDVYLYANEQPQELDGAYAIDPTHPAIEQQMKKISDLFHRAGFEYVKMDFMTHGAMEADKWYRPEIQTGIQAYNYGMKLLDKYFGDMYINLSISPVFPAHYAQSRRIACDAWNKIKDTEYTMNASSYGWWQNYVYKYNDADHIVLQQATEGENRARITSSIITGIFITGDDFSAGGSQEGKEKAEKFLTNPEINAVATGRAFRPVEGNGEFSESQFVRQEEDGTFYFALFNYSEQEVKTTISLDRIGLDAKKEYQMKELWSGKNVPVKESFDIAIPAKDVLLFKYKNN
ncbi:alpha-galactosidase [Parabacteroides sp. Marseille-P3160]|uniref:alpha-galactosidase n=1 Tax=Parabacteroides sp. Marseille-P3160 TaxID=1917887 RepID=UPI0009BBF8C2|nr:alpha-galactosidase [Parabacteroides sp. Marseille-P3160]